ncbi:hypothetical protein [Cellulosimicrobium protaetiae]
MDDIAGGGEQVLADDASPAQEPQEPIPVDPTTPPETVMSALGFDPETVQAVVVTADAVVAVAADYPEPQTREEA